MPVRRLLPVPKCRKRELHPATRPRQAERRAAGWVIHACELKFDGAVALEIPEQDPMPLRGRVDRIDYHEDTDTYCVIDYKTGDAGKPPHTVHQPSNCPHEHGWADLQLPLYHYLVRHSNLGVTGAIRLGYFLLPKQSGGVRLVERPSSGRDRGHLAEPCRGRRAAGERSPRARVAKGDVRRWRVSLPKRRI